LEEVGGGVFFVMTRPEDNSIVLEFSDNGPGVREPDRVFDPFYSTRPVGKGAGLGLSACYGIIREHHGSIVCTNRLEGGTSIRIELPFAGTRSLAEEATGERPADTPTTAAVESLPS
jgi:signal transduction histidine kinase